MGAQPFLSTLDSVWNYVYPELNPHQHWLLLPKLPFSIFEHRLALEAISASEYRIVDSARRFELWERNYGNFVGLGVAVDYALGVGLQRIGQQAAYLASQLRQRLAEVEGIVVGDLGSEKCGIVTFYHTTLAAQDIQARLEEKHM